MGTPRANLDRIVRHINGVYTQRYNRLKHTDGPLFRGRYKSILVDGDAYLLQVGRYIHRNPAEVKGATDKELDKFTWSSYLAYTNRAAASDWLTRGLTYRMLGQKKSFRGSILDIVHHTLLLTYHHPSYDASNGLLTR